MELILASASPRRRELLSNAGYEYNIQAADIDESIYSGLSPYDTVKELSAAKAAFVAKNNREAVVLGSDTIVSLDGEILGKPHSKQEAASMLRALSGKTHRVYTGVCAVLGSKSESLVIYTDVTFYELSESQIENYIETGEPMDKAGAYGIQGYGSVLVKGINGDYYTVMGLPMAETARLLSRFGVYGKIIDKI